MLVVSCMRKLVICRLKSISSLEGEGEGGKADDRWNRTGPLVLVSSVVALSRGRGENGRGTSHFSHSEEDFQTCQGQEK